MGDHCFNQFRNWLIDAVHDNCYVPFCDKWFALIGGHCFYPILWSLDCWNGWQPFWPFLWWMYFWNHFSLIIISFCFIWIARIIDHWLSHNVIHVYRLWKLVITLTPILWLMLCKNGWPTFTSFSNRGLYCCRCHLFYLILCHSFYAIPRSIFDLLFDTCFLVLMFIQENI